MKYEEVKDYWNQRAIKSSNSPQATTDDYYMREIEAKKIAESIQSLGLQAGEIADVGCGDGFTTIAIARHFPKITFYGFDYSSAMLRNAEKKKESGLITNVIFSQNDITQGLSLGKFDLIYSTRCLINLTSLDLQKKAIINIYNALKDNGTYIMVENFVDGHDEFNNLRKTFGLQEIKIREHNLYFNQDWLASVVEPYFLIQRIENISSLYYIISRIVYSKICQMQNVVPDYYDIHHELGAKLPSLGNFGPIKMLVVKRKG